jgi:hypothetical protein
MNVPTPTGANRTYAMWLLNHAEEVQQALCTHVYGKSGPAVRQARLLFPFPILGIDTDNGGEFINESLIAYCEQEQITFTRGRPYLKNDQCFVEQKNGAIVRQVVGYDRLVGEHASAATYRALPGATPVCQLLSALDETAVEKTRREKDSLRV